jgi:hypothetical protein
VGGEDLTVGAVEGERHYNSLDGRGLLIGNDLGEVWNSQRSRSSRHCYESEPCASLPPSASEGLIARIAHEEEQTSTSCVVISGVGHIRLKARKTGAHHLFLILVNFFTRNHANDRRAINFSPTTGHIIQPRSIKSFRRS